MMHPTGHLTKWLCCGCLILILGGFGLCGMQTRDATNNVTGIWKLSLSGISFSNDSDMPDHYQLTSQLMLYQFGNSIYGYMGNFPPHALKAEGKDTRFIPTVIQGFTANGRIWLFGSYGLEKSALSPMTLSIVGRVENFDTIVAEFILVQYVFEYTDFDKRPPMSEGTGATGACRAWKQDTMILVPDK